MAEKGVNDEEAKLLRWAKSQAHDLTLSKLLVSMFRNFILKRAETIGELISGSLALLSEVLSRGIYSDDSFDYLGGNRREQNDGKQKCIFNSIGASFCFGSGIVMVEDAGCRS